ncbi:protein of unknown function [Reichenbachiella faecimaris]|uniref:DUF4252 domain-containing protein n=2 Tax=Reichenbachiella faecimaris TaxID=692418 RepID=A0A1W2G807_REIFA|nr:protein of unknown function [Reichenbachiella faecimaris]
MIWSVSTMAQDNAISKYFAKHVSDTAFTKVTVTSKMFSLFTEIEGEDEAEKEVLEALSKLKGIKVLINEEPKDPATLYSNAVTTISKDKGYEELMSVEDGDENVKFMIRDKGSIINELLMIVGGKEEFLIMSLFGEIDLKQIAKLSRIMKMKGMDHLKVLDGGDDE